MIETVLRVERDRAQSYLDVAGALLVILYADGTDQRCSTATAATCSTTRAAS